MDPHEELAKSLTVETVVEKMQTRPTTATTQQDGVVTLCYMMEEYENTRRFLLCGGVEVLFGAMRLTSLNSDTQWRSMNILLASVFCDEDENIRDDIPSSIVDKNGFYLPAILTAMRIHVKNLDVQKIGVRLLSHVMTELNSDAVKTAASDAIITAGGVPVVVGAMNTHAGDKSLENNCMHILLGWVKRDETTRVLVWKHSGAVSVIRVMLRTHTAESSMEAGSNWLTPTGCILRFGCQILGWITRGVSHIAEEVALQGGVRAVVHAGPFLHPLTDEAEWALDEIAKTDVGVGAIVAQGGVNLLISRMQMWMSRSKLQGDKQIGTTWMQKRNCETLAEVASTQGGMDEIVRTGGIKLILDVMRGGVLLKIDPDGVSQVQKNELQTSACNLLAKFASREDVNMCIIDNGFSVLEDVQKDSHATDLNHKPIRSRLDEGVAFAVAGVLLGVHDTRARIIEKKMSFAKGMNREDTLPGALKPDIMQKILGFVDHGTSRNGSLPQLRRWYRYKMEGM
jgi:hypothetical protein